MRHCHIAITLFSLRRYKTDIMRRLFCYYFHCPMPYFFFFWARYAERYFHFAPYATPRCYAMLCRQRYFCRFRCHMRIAALITPLPCCFSPLLRRAIICHCAAYAAIILRCHYFRQPFRQRFDYWLIMPIFADALSLIIAPLHALFAATPLIAIAAVTLIHWFAMPLIDDTRHYLPPLTYADAAAAMLSPLAASADIAAPYYYALRDASAVIDCHAAALAAAAYYAIAAIAAADIIWYCRWATPLRLLIRHIAAFDISITPLIFADAPYLRRYWWWCHTPRHFIDTLTPLCHCDAAITPPYFFIMPRAFIDYLLLLSLIRISHYERCYLSCERCCHIITYSIALRLLPLFLMFLRYASFDSPLHCLRHIFDIEPLILLMISPSPYALILRFAAIYRLMRFSPCCFTADIVHYARYSCYWSFWRLLYYCAMFCFMPLLFIMLSPDVSSFRIIAITPAISYFSYRLLCHYFYAAGAVAAILLRHRLLPLSFRFPWRAARRRLCCLYSPRMQFMLPPCAYIISGAEICWRISIWLYAARCDADDAR